MSAPVLVESARVLPDRIQLTVRVSHEKYAQTNASLLQAVLVCHPYLLEHACRNAAGPTFGAVAAATSTPHLLEHLIIDYQLKLHETQDAHAVQDVLLVGTTQWDVHDPLLATVSLSYQDDVIAFAAINQALEELNDLLQNGHYF